MKKSIFLLLSALLVSLSAQAQTVKPQSCAICRSQSELSLYDAANKKIGPVLQAGCYSGTNGTLYDNVTTVVRVNDRPYLVCGSNVGFTGFSDLLFESSDCSGTGYLGPATFPGNASTLFVPGVVSNQDGRALLFAVDYSSQLVSVTYNSSRNYEGSCTVTSSGSYLLRPVVFVSDLSALYTGPFSVR